MPVHAHGADRPRIDPSAYIAPGAQVIGNVTIGEGSSVWPQAVLRGDYGKIVIGARTNIQDGAVIHVIETAIGTFDASGALLEVHGTTIDITVAGDRERHLRSIFYGSADAVLVDPSAAAAADASAGIDPSLDPVAAVAVATDATVTVSAP